MTNVLVTRATHAAARTATLLAAHGFDAIEAPLTEIAATGATWPRGVIDAVMATSAHAFAALAETDRPRPEARRLMPLFLVGAQTAAAAVTAGFEGHARVAADAEALVGFVGMALPPGRRLLYLAGRDRKPTLENALPAIGQGIEVLEVYEARARERLAPDVAASIRDGAVDAVLHYSRRSAALFCDCMARAETDARDLLHICISDDAAAPLAAIGCHRIATAAAPDEGAMIALLTALLQQAGMRPD